MPAAQVLADMVVHLFQEAAVGLALWPASAEDDDAALARLPEPMYPGEGSLVTASTLLPHACGVQRVSVVNAYI